MPIYEYRCENCGHELEAIQKVSEDPLRRCPDCDTDGLVNFLEFAFGTNPNVSDPGALTWDGVNPVVPGAPVLDISFPGGGGVNFNARFLRRKDHGTAGGVSYAVRFSSDLTDWEISAATPSPLADDASGDYELVEGPYPFFLSSGKFPAIWSGVPSLSLFALIQLANTGITTPPSSRQICCISAY